MRIKRNLAPLNDEVNGAAAHPAAAPVADPPEPDVEPDDDVDEDDDETTEAPKVPKGKDDKEPPTREEVGYENDGLEFGDFTAANFPDDWLVKDLIVDGE